MADIKGYNTTITFKLPYGDVTLKLEGIQTIAGKPPLPVVYVPCLGETVRCKIAKIVKDVGEQ